MEKEDKLRCRFYENKYPEENDVVMVRVNEIAEMGAYVSLLEYDDVEGMILLSELSRRRIRAISKLIRVGKNEVVVVLRVNKEKGYIDLSKSRVTPEDRKACVERYQRSKSVHNLFYHVAKKCDISLLKLYETIGWPLYKKFGHAFNAFMLIANENFECLEPIQFSSEKVREEFIKIVKKRMKPQDVKTRTDVEVTCFTSEGIHAIKRALKAGEECDTETNQLKISLVAPPLYVMTYISKSEKIALEMLEKALKKVDEAIKKEGGKMTIKIAPRVVSQKDDKSLTQLFELLEKQNREVDGDDDGEWQ